MNQSAALMQLLESLPEGIVWYPRLPGSADLLAAVEEELEVELPEIYRRLVLAHDGAELIGPRGVIANFRIGDLIEVNTDERWAEDLPGMFFFSGDSGGRVYYMDLKNQLGRGKDAIYIVGMGTGTLEFTKFVASSLYELYRKVIAGEPLTTGGFLGDELDELPELHN